jgi:hypothetical protein
MAQCRIRPAVQGLRVTQRRPPNRVNDLQWCATHAVERIPHERWFQGFTLAHEIFKSQPEF